MIKRTASRTHRSKGFVRAKQILQILLLFGICFWLVYQLKYSHDKKKAILDDKDSKISDKELDGLKSGRKELLPRVYDKQQSAAEEDEDKVEDEDERSNNKVEEMNDEQLEDDLKKAHEEVELEEEEEEIVKNDEPENHEKPGELEVEEEEGEDHEEFIDEEKAKEEEPENEGNGEEMKNKQVEEDDEDQDHDEISQEVHEAREEHYKGDDASSAVTHDTEIDVVHNNDSTVEITEDSSGLESSNGNEDHDIATELANSSPTDETELGNAATLDPELNESSSNHSENSSLVGSDSKLRLPSNTTESSETN